nr:MAG TPA: hypothetical protein [Caudoviricetes sp.]
MNKLVKTCIIGVTIYEAFNLGGYIGKGSAIGLLAGLGTSGSDAIEELSTDKRWQNKLVVSVAKFKKKTIES